MRGSLAFTILWLGVLGTLSWGLVLIIARALATTATIL